MRFKKRHDEKGKAERVRLAALPALWINLSIPTTSMVGRVTAEFAQTVCKVVPCAHLNHFKVVSPSDTIQINENGFRYFRLFSWLKLECPFTDIVLQDEDY